MLFKKRDTSLQIFNYDRCVFDSSVFFEICCYLKLEFYHSSFTVFAWLCTCLWVSSYAKMLLAPFLLYLFEVDFPLT